nr:prephenate/arogenate dehydrogenase [Synechococcus elongatus]
MARDVMRIGIVGLGLIGGSLGFDWRDRGHTVLGYSRRPETCERAIARGVVDTASSDPTVLQDAEVIVLATPLGALETTVQELRSYWQPDAIVTDVGSVKQPIVSALEPLWPRFVGGHPMAGTSENGIEAALRGLFHDRPYVLTPTDQTDPEAIAVVELLAQELGSVVLRCDPVSHDRAVAAISHLPVFVSASLIQTCLQEPDPDVQTLAATLASSGFRDTSRVGGGNPELGAMMARFNRVALLEQIDRYQTQLERLKTAIAAADDAAIAAILQQNQEVRPRYL